MGPRPQKQSAPLARVWLYTHNKTATPPHLTAVSGGDSERYAGEVGHLNPVFQLHSNTCCLMENYGKLKHCSDS